MYYFDNWVFGNFTLTNELFVRALLGPETCLPVTSKLCEKLILLFPIMFDDNLILSVAYFVADFNLLSCQSGNFTFTLWYWIFLHQYQINMYSASTKLNTFAVPCENGFFYFFSNEDIVVFRGCYRLPVKVFLSFLNPH